MKLSNMKDGSMPIPKAEVGRWKREAHFGAGGWMEDKLTLVLHGLRLRCPFKRQPTIRNAVSWSPVAAVCCRSAMASKPMSCSPWAAPNQPVTTPQRGNRAEAFCPVGLLMAVTALGPLPWLAQTRRAALQFGALPSQSFFLPPFFPEVRSTSQSEASPCLLHSLAPFHPQTLSPMRFLYF